MTEETKLDALGPRFPFESELPEQKGQRCQNPKEPFHSPPTVRVSTPPWM